MLLEIGLAAVSLLLLVFGAAQLWAVRELRRLRRDVFTEARHGSVPALLIHAALGRIEQRLATLETTASAIPSLDIGIPAEIVASVSLGDPMPPPPPVIDHFAEAMAGDPRTSGLPWQNHAASPEPAKPADPAADVPDAYTLARQLAQQGADVQALVQSCALSRDEAELVLRMHGAAE